MFTRYFAVSLSCLYSSFFFCPFQNKLSRSFISIMLPCSFPLVLPRRILCWLICKYFTKHLFSFSFCSSSLPIELMWCKQQLRFARMLKASNISILMPSWLSGGNCPSITPTIITSVERKCTDHANTCTYKALIGPGLICFWYDLHIRLISSLRYGFMRWAQRDHWIAQG